jgi:hypothetical protein
VETTKSRKKFFDICFHSSIRKVTKSRSRGAFRFALRKSRLLEKAAFWIHPFGWLLAFREAKAKAKSQTKHTLSLIHPLLEVGPSLAQTRIKIVSTCITIWIRTHNTNSLVDRTLGSKHQQESFSSLNLTKQMKIVGLLKNIN